MTSGESDGDYCDLALLSNRPNVSSQSHSVPRWPIPPRPPAGPHSGHFIRTMNEPLLAELGIRARVRKLTREIEPPGSVTDQRLNERSRAAALPQ